MRQAFQKLLTERIFPPTDDGHDVIKFQSYILRNISTAKDILPSSPGVGRLRSIIGPDDRVEMSVIVPYEETDTSFCPRCGTSRDDISSVDVVWYANLDTRVVRFALLYPLTLTDCPSEPAITVDAAFGSDSLMPSKTSLIR